MLKLYNKEIKDEYIFEKRMALSIVILSFVNYISNLSVSKQMELGVLESNAYVLLENNPSNNY